MRSISLVVTGMLLTACASAPAPAPTAAAPNALVELNAAFRAAYGDARLRALATVDPLIIHAGDRVTLVRNGRRADATARPAIYDSLKTIAHIPLAIYVALTPGEGPLDDSRAATLIALRDRIAPALATVRGQGLAADQLARQERVASQARSYIDGVLAVRRSTRGALVEYTRSAAPLVLANVAEATRAELDTVHRQVTAWRGEMSPAEWRRLHVVVIGAHMPRERETATAYYLRLLGEPAEGGRVVYAESLWDEKRALDLLGTHVLDGGIGDAFFGDPRRMHRDLLGDDAAAYLERLLPGGGS
jgi:hypothetical protein